MRLVPGMQLSHVDSQKLSKVVFVDGRKHLLHNADGAVQEWDINMLISLWKPTGEVDWSMVPGGTDISHRHNKNHDWIGAKFIGYLPGEKCPIYLLRRDKSYTWADPLDVRIPQPEPVPTPKPAIDFESDPPRPGDKYVRKDAATVTFVGKSFCKDTEDKWIFEDGDAHLETYPKNGKYNSDYACSVDIVSRKPNEPTRHKEKFWVQIYPLRTNEVYLRVWDITDKNKFKPDEDCLACKEIEIEWEKGEGL